MLRRRRVCCGVRSGFMSLVEDGCVVWFEKVEKRYSSVSKGFSPVDVFRVYDVDKVFRRE